MYLDLNRVHFRYVFFRLIWDLGFFFSPPLSQQQQQQQRKKLILKFI